MRDAFRDVIEFEIACGNPLADHLPTVPDANTLDLRENLISEEFDELMSALWEVEHDPDAEQMANIADGIADLIWVAIGTAIRFGIDLPVVWEHVKAANMAKFGPGSWRRSDGKLMKSPTWVPPDIVGVIQNQKPLTETYGSTESCEATS